jgi:hypothetical protein
MKSGLTVKKVALLFTAVLAVYLALFFWIEKSRLTKGPWQVDFQAAAGGDATLVVTQPYLSITNARVIVHLRSREATCSVRQRDFRGPDLPARRGDVQSARARGRADASRARREQKTGAVAAGNDRRTLAHEQARRATARSEDSAELIS